LDGVIDDTYYFFKENEKIAKDIRRTGLGILGLADALIKMKLKYGAPESEPTIKKIFETLRNEAYDASADIAKEKGAFPKFNKEKYLKGYHIQRLPKEIQAKIAKNGIRNAVLLTIAPTGTTSLISGVSSGVEPVYEFEFIRRDRLGEHKMYHPLYEEWKKENPDAEKPGYFVSANDLTPEEHVTVQAIAQEYIDSSISKTVNAPNAHTVDDVKNLYMLAYDNGLKGVTYMRDGSREGVLSRVEEKKEEVVVPDVVNHTKRAPRPMMMEGVTYKTQTPVGDTYITLNHDQNREPFEMFITIGKTGSDVAAMAEALGRMISLNLSLAGNLPPRERIRQVISQLSGIGGARSVGFGENRVRSLPDAVAKILAKQYAFKVNGVVEDKLVPSSNVNGHSESDLPITADAPVEVKTETQEEITVLQQLPLQEGITMENKPKTHAFDICPECGTSAFVYEEGCGKCYACGHSEC
jgi:ribonucleoside-diphosphate reductase alpha chain